MGKSFQDYLKFCRRFQEQNEFEFNEHHLVKPTEDKAYHSYDATYRDDGNYKTNVELRYDGRAITWELEEGWHDAHVELSRLYCDIFASIGTLHRTKIII
ncbi:MAG: hypothetical protein WDZ91_09605 [Paenibacillaceae bacterium]